MKIFIVDDSSFSRKVIADAILRAAPDAVLIPFAEPEEALARFPGEKPDLVTIDMVMPKMHGIELIEKLRATGVPTRLVVITADIQASTRERCAALQVNDFIEKPITAEKIRAAFARILAA